MSENLRSKDLLQSHRPDLSLVIPCFNEEDVIRNTAVRLVQSFRDKQIDLELVLIDNGSTDNTGKILDEMIAEGLPIVKARIEVNQGYGNGILRGLPFCRGEYIGLTCADGQVEEKDVVRIYEIAASATKPKLVKVRRRFRMDGLMRKVISVIYNLIANIFFAGLRSIDINGNPKILPREYLERMDLRSRDWFLDAEVMIKAKRLGLEVYELNVMAQMREGGESNVRASTIWEFVLNLLKYSFTGAGTVDAEPGKTVEHGGLPDRSA